METLTTLSTEKIEFAAFILKTIAHPFRLGVIDQLKVHERLSVNELCEKLNCEQSLASHHLTNMKLKGLLEAQREGKNIFYTLKMKEVLEIIACLEKCKVKNFNY